jgi:predicted adenylyl cyclase CyaB
MQGEVNSQNMEVEVRALIKSEKGLNLVEKVEQLGGSQLKEEIITDVYYCPNSVTSFKEIEMDAVGSYSLRLRKAVKNAVTTVEMNTKRIVSFGDHNSWEEHEVVLDSFDEGRSILNTMGFKAYFEFTKHRKSYKFGDLTVCLEDIENFGTAIEVEGITDKAGAETMKTKIFSFLESIGVNKDEIVPKSVTNILMKEWAKF